MKCNYKHIFFSLMLVLCSCGLFAQTSDTKKDKIDALRAAYIAKRLSLTDQESRAFWPLYNEMNDKIAANLKVFRSQYNTNTNYNFNSDAEAKAYINAQLQLREREAAIYREYYEKFQKVLPVKKVAALNKAEEDFRKEIINIVKTQ